MTTGPIRRDCSRCGRHGYPATNFPDGYLCGPCLRTALDIRGPCPGCGIPTPEEGFYRDRSQPSGRKSRCRACQGDGPPEGAFIKQARFYGGDCGSAARDYSLYAAG